MRVRDAMTPDVEGVRDTAQLSEAVERMSRRRVSVLFVFDERKALVGALSEGDLMRRGELGAERREPRWLESLMNGGRLAHLYARRHGRLVAKAMTRDVVSVGEDAPLAEAIELMIRRRVSRVPVMRGGAVIGVLSRAELLKRLYLAPAREATPEREAEEAASRAPIRVSIDNALNLEPPSDRLA
jgi:CBS domain-containing protein